MRTLSELLTTYFDSILTVKPEVWENFAALGSVTSYSKDAILKPSHTTERYFSFLIEGSGGNLFWDTNNFVCTDLSMQHEPLCDYVSFMTQQPSPIEVRVFEDSRIFRINHQHFQRIFEKGNVGEQVTRSALELAYKEKEQQQIDLLTKSAKQRYLELTKRNDQIERIQLRYVASYLGITPQSLSRIRSGKM